MKRSWVRRVAPPPASEMAVGMMQTCGAEEGARGGREGGGEGEKVGGKGGAAAGGVGDGGGHRRGLWVWGGRCDLKGGSF